VYVFGYVGKERRVMNKLDDTWVAPLLHFRYYKNNGIIESYSSNNLLQSGFYKMLNAGDTLSIRESYIQFNQ
jgi:hypothetical protein